MKDPPYSPPVTLKDRHEIRQSKIELERLLNREAETFAYPGGGFNVRVRQAVIDAGYLGAVATHPGSDYPDRDPYALKRIRISRSCDNLFVFWFKISGFYTIIEEWRG